MATSLAKILEFGQDADKFHPAAVKEFGEFISKIQSRVDLRGITDEDMRAYLNDSDYHNLLAICQDLVKYLAKNRLTKDFTVKDVTSLFPWTYGFETLLKRVSGQKILQQRLKEAKANAQFRAYQDSRRRHREWEEAKAEHGQWLDRVNKSLETLEANLSKNTKPKFQKQAWLKSYHPKVWVKHLSGPTIDWFTAKTSILVAAYKVTLEEAIWDLVDVKFFYWDYHLPAVKYEAVSPPLVSVKGHPFKAKPRVPCLKWRLAAHIISLTEFWQTEGTITDTRCGYDFQVKSSSEKLGGVYSGPEFWEYQDAFVTPLSLLAMLACGGELLGVETVKIDKPWTTYRVEGFADEISLHEDFGHFIQDMTKKTSLDKALLKRGMCDEQTALLVRAKLEKLKESETPTAVPEIASGLKSKTGDDYTDVVYNLTHQMGYKDTVAKKAAEFACEKNPNGTVLEKIKMALQFFEQ